MDKITHHVRVERWKTIMNECLASGMKKTAWCRANAISKKQFFYWQRIFRKEAYEVTRKANLPATTEKELPTSRIVSFTEVKYPSVELLSSIGGIFHAE